MLSTRAMRPRHIVRRGKRRWRIEGFLKTAKGCFSLDRFGQGRKLVVYRYLLLSLVIYLLAHWGHLSQEREGLLPRWAEAARTPLEEALAETVIEGLLEIEERGVLLRSHGI